MSEPRGLALQLVVGSTRPNRAADLVLPWIVDRISRCHDFELELLDLREWDLPMFAETPQTVGDPLHPTYSAPVVREWNATIRRADAYIVLTPEYNHGVPGVVKNAFDSVYMSHAFRNKPIAFVGYSGGIGAGIRAVEHLIQIAVTAELVPLRSTVQIAGVQSAFDDAGNPHQAATEDGLRVLLEDLGWWGRLLRRGRMEGELPPVARRVR